MGDVVNIDGTPYKYKDGDDDIYKLAEALSLDQVVIVGDDLDDQVQVLLSDGMTKADALFSLEYAKNALLTGVNLIEDDELPPEAA